MRLVHLRQRAARRALVIAVLLVLATIAIVGPATSTSNAAAPTSVTIELLRNGPPGSEATTWSSSGAFVDSGTWTIDRFICGACPSPVTGAPYFNTTATSGLGTFAIRLHSMFNLLQPNEVNSWEITSGTGTYTKLIGHGSFTVNVDVNDVRHIILTGQVG